MQQNGVKDFRDLLVMMALLFAVVAGVGIYKWDSYETPLMAGIGHFITVMSGIGIISHLCVYCFLLVLDKKGQE